MKTQIVANIINSDLFQKAIKNAIEHGKGVDYGYDGEDECAFDTFDSDKSFQEVIEVLKHHLLRHEDNSDLENFVKLYASFGIECKIDSSSDIDFKYIHLKNEFESKNTDNDKFVDGRCREYSKIKFDREGKFVSQEFNSNDYP